MSVVLITGSSSGFGESTALAFARSGHVVYASMRSPTKNNMLIKSAKKESLDVHLITLDVTDKESIDRAVRNIVQAEGHLDILVNNAGIHIPGAIEDMPEDDIHRVMNTNFFGVLNVTRAVLPIMRNQGGGRIIMLSSVGAMIGRVSDAIYCASKSALETAAEALLYEVAPFDIKVSVVEPGVFRTDIGSKYELSPEYPGDSVYRELLAFRVGKVKESCTNGDDPEIVAKLIVDIARSEHPHFRYAAGKQAEGFLASLKQMDEKERDKFIRTASGIDWWLNRLPEPKQE